VNSRTLPLMAFVLLVVLLVVGLKIADRKTELPSPLVGKPAPAFDLPVLGEPGKTMSKESFLGTPYLVNFWASWCPTCRIEHPVITELAELEVLRVIGLNFRDETATFAMKLRMHKPGWYNLAIPTRLAWSISTEGSVLILVFMPRQSHSW